MLRGKPMALWVAEALERRAMEVTVVGKPDLHGPLGYPVIEDLLEGCGPLAGIVTALAKAQGPWSLICACDMPLIGSAPLDSLFETASRSAKQALVPLTPDGRLQPLCAVYAKSAHEPLDRALERGVRRITEALDALAWEPFRVTDGTPFTNVNRPSDLAPGN